MLQAWCLSVCLICLSVSMSVTLVDCDHILQLLQLQLPNSLLFRTACASRHQKGRTVLDFTEARDDGMAVAQLDHMQIICISLQSHNHASTHDSPYWIVIT